jgi:hypothetical protein
VTTADDLSLLRSTPFVEAVLKLEELMTQSGRAFLIGSGCSKCAGLPLMTELTEKVLGSPTLDANAKEVLYELKSLFEGTTDANVEDYLSELIDLLAIAERRAIRGAKKKQVDLNGKKVSVDQLREAVEQIKRAITEVIDCSINIETHRNFIRAVHRPLRPGKADNSQIVDYLVLNYDTLLEDTLAIERVPFADGLDGGVTGWWSPPTFRREGLAARVLKLHGSINWCELPDDPLPRRVAKRLSIKPIGNYHILIWPASTKYRETQRDPYAQLAEIARGVLRPKTGSQQVLLVCGYRFGDAHINIEIDNALRESEGRLTVVIFTATDKLMGQLKAWNDDMSISEQVLIFSKRGFFHGKQAEISPVDLPWWKFENLTRLLGGER